MNELELIGWARGLKTVSLIQAIKEHSGMSLLGAKQLVEQLTVGQKVSLNFTSMEAREKFKKIAEGLGVTCR